LASSRATNYAALIPAPKNEAERKQKKDFIIELCKWDNSLNKTLIEQARKDILEANGGKPPKVLDPFSGGGAIPLEALRLGCETYANDYNPVAVLIEKCTLEYPQKYGEKLVKDVKKWGDWVLEEARKELEEFYPADVEEKKTALGKTRTESISVGYIWARTIRCQNPSCEAEIPLMRQYWLAKKPGKQITLYPYVSGKQVKYKIVGTGYEPMPDGFDPEKGSVSKAIATCPVCGGVTEAKDVRKQFQQGRSGQRMIAVVLTRREESGKKYRIATEKDLEIYKRAEKRLVEKSAELENEWGINPVPDEIIPTPCHEVDRPPMYGMRTWGELFNNRQKLALITFTQKVKQAHKEMLRQKYEEEYAKAVTSYLGLNLDRIAAYCSLLGYWHVSREIVSPAMQRQALVMVFDYVENNTLTEFFSWDTNLDWILKVIPHCSRSSKNAIISQSSATSLPFQDNFFDAIFTDPPYYDNVAYSYLSDFFYVWLKRSMGDLHPDLFFYSSVHFQAIINSRINSQEKCNI